MKPFLAIPIVALLVHRAWSRKSLTPFGLLAAVLTAIAHAVHPWSAPLLLLVVFYLGGTKATKVKHNEKSRYTQSASGAAGGESQRNHIQVLANSIVATVLILLHVRSLRVGGGFTLGRRSPEADVFVVGIVAYVALSLFFRCAKEKEANKSSNYAAVAADTFSSELGILSKSKPRLITSLTLREVPRGTNGGVTTYGLLAGVFGAFTVALTSAILLPFDLSGNQSDGSGLYVKERVLWTLAMTIWGTLGSVLDSILGSLLQASVVDKATNRVVEGDGGRRVLIHPSSTSSGGTANTSSSASDNPGNLRPRQAETAANDAEPDQSQDHESRRVESGRDLLDNNMVNVLMAALMSLGGMAGSAWLWGVYA